MGTCCSAHLATKVRDYAKNAQNGAVTVTVIENPKITAIQIEGKELTKVAGSSVVMQGVCDYCQAPAEFTCSYYSK